MSDIEQITAVLVRYATGIDSRDWKLFRTCFTENCRLDYGPLGNWDNRESVTRFMERVHSGPSLHRLSNFAIAVEGGVARSRCYVDALVYGPGGWGGARTIGYYDDELVLSSEGWRIVKRHLTGVNMRFLGIMGIIPSSIASRLAAVGSRRFNAMAQNKR